MSGVTFPDSLRYPGSSDQLGLTPTYLQQLAEDVQKAINRRRQTGKLTVTSGSWTSGQGIAVGSVAFPYAFDSAPRIQLTLNNAPGGSATLVPRASGISATGFTVYCYNLWSASVTLTGNLDIAWYASLDTL